MAYIKNTTFDYFSGSNIDNFLDDCFDVDDAIAPVIKVLNLKGYTTNYCCSGHPCGVRMEMFWEDCDDDPMNFIVGIISAEKLPDSKNSYRILFDTPAIQLYISFGEDYAFEKIPDGFTYESGVLEYFIQSEEPYDFLYERLNMRKRLYDWATQLPECSKQR